MKIKHKNGMLLKILPPRLIYFQKHLGHYTRCPTPTKICNTFKDTKGKLHYINTHQGTKYDVGLQTNMYQRQLKLSLPAFN